MPELRHRNAFPSVLQVKEMVAAASVRNLPCGENVPGAHCFATGVRKVHADVRGPDEVVICKEDFERYGPWLKRGATLSLVAA